MRVWLDRERERTSKKIETIQFNPIQSIDPDNTTLFASFPIRPSRTMSKITRRNMTSPPLSSYSVKKCYKPIFVKDGFFDGVDRERE